MVDEYKIDREKQIIFLKGEETFIPGILEKTIKSFKIITQMFPEYDYIVRSNISTIVNLKLLREKLYQYETPILYGGYIRDLQWCGSGITTSCFFGTLFASGIGIIFSKSTINIILDNTHLLRYDIIDDVALGVLFKEHFPKIANNVYYLKETDYIFIKENIENIDLGALRTVAQMISYEIALGIIVSFDFYLIVYSIKVQFKLV